MINSVFNSVDKTLVAVWLWCVDTLPFWAAVLGSVLDNLLGFTLHAYVISFTAWCVTEWAAYALVAVTLVEVATFIVWVDTLNSSDKTLDWVAVSASRIGAVVSFGTWSFTDLWLARVSLASAVVWDCADNFVRLAQWFFFTWWSVSLGDGTFTVLFETLVDDTVVFPNVANLVSLAFLYAVTVGVIGCSGSWSWCTSYVWSACTGYVWSACRGWCSGTCAFVCWATACSYSWDGFDCTVFNITVEFGVSLLWWTLGWALAFLVYTHTFVSLWCIDFGASISRLFLVKSTSVVLGNGLLVAYAVVGGVKSKLGAILSTLVWCTANDLASTSVVSDRFVLVCFADNYFWTWWWGGDVNR